MKDIVRAIRGFLRDETGATAVEYGLIIALIAAVIVLIVSALGGKLKEAFCEVLKALNNNTVPSGVTCT